MFNSRGTIIFALPSRDGLVVAADSRQTACGHIFDTAKKLEIAECSHPVVVTITGNAVFHKPLPLGANLGDWLQSGDRVHDGLSIVQSFIARQPDFLLDKESMGKVLKHLTDSLQDFFDSQPDISMKFRSREISQLVLLQTRSLDDMRISFSSIRLDIDGKVQNCSVVLEQYSQTSEMPIRFFGESAYVEEHVFSSGGQPLDDEEAAKEFMSASEVSERSAHIAARFAASAIRAAELATTKHPTPSGAGIGGPVNIVCLRANDVQKI